MTRRRAPAPPPAAPAHRRDRGVSLLELAIAVLVLSIGVIAAFRSIDQSRRVIGDAPARLFAHQVALNRAEALHLPAAALDAGGLPARVSYGGIDWAVNVTGARTVAGFGEQVITVTAPDLPGARIVTYTLPDTPGAAGAAQ